MPEYFYRADQLAFQYQTLSILRELRFRLNELSAASKVSIDAFQRSIIERTTNDDVASSMVVRYRFSSAIGLLQTLKDVLATAISGFSWSAFVSQLSQAETVQNLRNAMVHDGQQPVALWADGQCYIAVNISRPGLGKKVHEICAPADDVETLTLRFFGDFAERLHSMLIHLPESQKHFGPPLPREWFEAAMKHPSLKRFQLELPPPTDVASANGKRPLDACQEVLGVIAAECRARLVEISQLPVMPFR